MEKLIKCSLDRLQFVRHLHSSIAVYGYAAITMQIRLSRLLPDVLVDCDSIMPLGVPSQEIEEDSGPSLHNLLSHGTEVSAITLIAVCLIGLVERQLTRPCFGRICCLGRRYEPVSRSWTASATISPGTARSLAQSSSGLHQQR